MLNGRFSFLHISDLHFADESTSAEVFREEIVTKLRKEELAFDCLVISGDLFNRGSLSADGQTALREFLGKLPTCKRILVVPGNHDLDRMARVPQKTGFNRFIARRELVLEKVKSLTSAEGEFGLNDAEKEVLYRQSFQGFQQFSTDMRFGSFNSANATGPLRAENYEVQCVDVPFDLKPGGNKFDDYKDYKVRFVLLNTALVAGQSLYGRQYVEKREAWERAFREALNSGKTSKANQLRMEITTQENYYMNSGELIIDEGEPNISGGVTPESKSGRLSLSKEGNRLLTALKGDPSVPVTIFVGHHGFQYLSVETQKNLSMVMRACGSGLYFCGHAHEEKYKRFAINGSSYPREIEQFQAGRMFRDETNVTEYGFNYASFEVNDAFLSGQVSAYFFRKAPSGQLQWDKEVIRCDSPRFYFPWNEPIIPDPVSDPDPVPDPDPDPDPDPVPDPRQGSGPINIPDIDWI